MRVCWKCSSALRLVVSCDRRADVSSGASCRLQRSVQPTRPLSRRCERVGQLSQWLPLLSLLLLSLVHGVHSELPYQSTADCSTSVLC